LLRICISSAFLAIIILLLFTIYEVFKGSNRWVIVISILLLGFITRMTVSFSPTIWASGSRTFTFLFFAIIICTSYLVTNNLQERELSTSDL
jgi:hypothetical protein